MTEEQTQQTNREAGRHRVQLDFSQDAYEKLMSIKQIAGVKTLSELIRNAVRLYSWYLEQKSKGHSLQIATPTEVKSVEIVF